MAGFYGNVRNSTSNSFKFDRIYSNRALMDRHKDDDGVFGGRYVLVEYDQGINERVENSSVSAIYYKINDKYYLEEPTVEESQEILYLLESVDNFYKLTTDTRRDDNKTYYIKENGRYKIYTGTVSSGQLIYENFINSEEIYYIKNNNDFIEAPLEDIYDELEKTNPKIYKKIKINKYELTVSDETSGKDSYNHEDFDLIQIFEKEIFIDENDDDYQLIESQDPEHDDYYFYNDNYYDKKYQFDNEGNVIVESNTYIELYTEDRDEPYLMDANTEDNYQINYAIDKAAYKSVGRGYDSTVWRKVYQEGVAKYVNIAELNSVVPTFAVTADAPSDIPWDPHFDKDSTNVYYNLHMQTPWGFMVTDIRKLSKPKIVVDGQEVDNPLYIMNLNNKSDATEIVINAETLDAQHSAQITDSVKYDGAIYFNKLGFNRDINSIYSGVNVNKNRIQIDEFNSGKKYPNHDEDSGTNFEQKNYNDVKGLSVILPAIGDTLSEMWDTIYGPSDYQEVTRDTFVAGNKYYERLERTNNDPFYKYMEYTGNEYKDGLYEPVKEKGKLSTRRVFHGWEDPNNLSTFDNERRHMVHYRAWNGWSDYIPEEADSLVGTINSVHDLMGMIVTKEQIPAVSTNDSRVHINPGQNVADPQKAHTWQIYYINNNGEDRDVLGEDDKIINDGLKDGHFYYVTQYPNLTDIVDYSEMSGLSATKFKETYNSTVENPQLVFPEKVQLIPTSNKNAVYTNEINGNVYVRAANPVAEPGWHYYTLPTSLEYIGHVDNINTDNKYYKYSADTSDYTQNVPIKQERASNVIKKFSEYTGDELLERWKTDPNNWYQLILEEGRENEEVTGYVLNENWKWHKTNADYLNKDSYVDIGSIDCSDGAKLLTKYEQGLIKSEEDLMNEILNSRTTGLDIEQEQPKIYFIHEKRDEDNKVISWYFQGISLNQILYNDKDYYDKSADGKTYYQIKWPLYATYTNTAVPTVDDPDTPRVEGTYTYYTWVQKPVNLLSDDCWYAVFADENNNPLDAIARKIDSGDTEQSKIAIINPKSEDTIINENNPIISFNKVSVNEVDQNIASHLHSYWKIYGGEIKLAGGGLTTNRLDNLALCTNENGERKVGYYTDSDFYYYKQDTNTYLPATSMYGFDAHDDLPKNLYVQDNQYYIAEIRDDYSKDYWTWNNQEFSSEIEAIAARGSNTEEIIHHEPKFKLYQKFNAEIIKEDADIAKYFGGNNPILKIARKKDSKIMRELPGFHVNINTLHGLLLKINEILKTGDLRTRDGNTVQGAINQLHDILDSFEPLIPGELYGVNENGKLGPVKVNSNNDDGESWVDLYSDFDPTTGQMIFNIVHNNINNFNENDSTHLPLSNNTARNTELTKYVNDLKNQLDADKQASGDKAHDPFGFISPSQVGSRTINNVVGNKLIINSPVIDNAGHVIGEKLTTIRIADVLLETNGNATIGTLTSPLGNVSITSGDTVRNAINKLITHINNGADNITLNRYDEYYGDIINDDTSTFPYIETDDSTRKPGKVYYVKEGNIYKVYTADPWPTNHPTIYEKLTTVENGDNLNNAIVKLQWQLDHIVHAPLTDLNEHKLPSTYDPYGPNASINETDSLGQGLWKLQQQLETSIGGSDNTTGITNNFAAIIRTNGLVPTTQAQGGNGTVYNSHIRSGWIWIDMAKHYVYIKTEDGYKTDSNHLNEPFADDIDKNFWELLNAWQ